MRKILNLVQALPLLAVCLVGGSCTKEIKTGDYPDPAPSSVYNVRRVEIKDDLVFGETSFRAVVTSDITNGNFNNKLLVIQDLNEEAAIGIELSAANTSLLKDDVVTVNLKGARLTNKAGEPVVVNLPLDQIKASGEQKSLTPKSTSIAALLANAKYWGPILVKLDKVTIYNDNSEQLSGDLLIDDEIAEMTVSFKPGSVFAAQDNPGYVESLIGVAYTNGTDWLLYPRSLDDIKVGVSELLEDFEQASNTNYDSKVMNFVTGAWTIDGGITATSTADLRMVNKVYDCRVLSETATEWHYRHEFRPERSKNHFGIIWYLSGSCRKLPMLIQLFLLLKFQKTADKPMKLLVLLKWIPDQCFKHKHVYC